MKKAYTVILLWVALLLPATLHAQEQELSVLCIGNSFTYYHDTNLLLEQIARSQGHALRTKSCTVGGYTFLRHLKNDDTQSAICYNRYDVCFLQDQSQTPAILAQSRRRGRSIARDARQLADHVRFYSPQVTIWLEQTWSYTGGHCGGFGTLQHFDQLLRKGTRRMARKAHTKVSPIGEAFAIVRAERPTVNLYEQDDKHPSALGSYLKSCVNYLLIYRQPFQGQVADCGNDSTVCQYLRQVAQRVVLKGEKGF